MTAADPGNSRSPGPSSAIRQQLDEEFAAVREWVERMLGEGGDIAHAAPDPAQRLDGLASALRSEIPGLASLLDEMARLVQAIRDHTHPSESDEAYVALTAATWQVAGYGEYLGEGHADRPLAVAELVNELRRVRGADPLPAGALVQPDETRPAPDELGTSDALADHLSDWRREYQAGLLDYLSADGDVAGGLRRLEATLGRITGAAPEPWLWRLAVAGRAVLVALEQNELSFSPEIARCLRQVDRELRRLAGNGLEAWMNDPPRALAGSLALTLAGLDSSDGRIREAAAAFRLAEQVPSTDEGARIRAALGGLGPDAWARVQDALGEDFAQAKELIDIHVRSGSTTPDDLKEARDLVHKVGDTLRLLGRETAAEHIDEQLTEFDTALEGAQAPQDLLAVAQNLLAIERRVLSADEPAEGVVPEEAESDLGGDPAPDEEAEGLDAAVLRQQALSECMADLERIRQVLEDVEEAPHAAASMSRVADVCELLEAQGSLDLARAIARGLEVLPTADSERLQSDLLAGLDALSDALRQERDGGTVDGAGLSALVGKITAHGLEAASDASPAGAPSDLSPAEADEADIATTELAATESPADPRAESESAFEGAEISAPDAAVPAAGEPSDPPSETASDAPQYTGSAALDPEVAEIFIEEAAEIETTLDGLLPEFAANPGDFETLGEIRRAFHTLKGSGRLAGAVEIGDFAYAVENMLNRTLDGTVAPASDALTALLKDARGAIPALLEHFRKGGALPAVTSDIIARADAMRDGQDATGEPSPAEAGAAEMAFPGEPALAPPPDGDAAPEPPVAVTGEEAPGASASPAGPDPTPDPPASERNVTGLGETGPQAALAEDSPERAEASEPTFDPALIEIFMAEAKTHLDAFESFAAEVQSARAAVELSTESSIIQAAHTLQGSAYMAGIQSMGELARSLELLIREHARQHVAVAAATGELISETAEALRAALDALGESGRETAPHEDLIQRLADARRHVMSAPAEDTTPQAETPDAQESGEEFLEVFLEEAGDLLEEIESAAATWRTQPDDPEAEFALSRALHTLKGSARTVGMSALGSLVHALESAVIGIAGTDASQRAEFFSLLDDTLEVLGEQIERLAVRGEMEPVTDLVERLEAFVAARRGDDAPHPHRAETADAVPAGPDAEPPTELGTPAPDAEAADEPKAEAPGGSGGRERLRVSAELLDWLSNEAAEIAITGGRVTQHVSNIRFNLGELERTISRLRDQLRRMEQETESQIMARYEPELDRHAEDFDPLEMDRYSQLQQLSRGLAETAGDLHELQATLDQETWGAEAALHQQARQSSSLQEGLLSTRMVPFSSLLTRLRRVVRKTGTELGKKVELRAAGVWENLDRRVLERMASPLEHLMRNAVDHGIETSEARRAAGKPETGTISVQVRREGAQAVVVINDDGRGLDHDKIAARARELGLLQPDESLSPEQLTEILVDSGFSTASEVSEISGRGVGLDAVNAVTQELGGQFEIDSAPGRGTWFTLRLPLTLAMTRALFVGVGREQYGILMNSIDMVAREPGQALEEYLANPQERYRHRESDYRVTTLTALVDGDTNPHLDPDHKYPVLLVHRGEENWAVVVDELLSSREVVVKSVGAQITTVPGIAGATIMADGDVVLILDLTARLPMAGRSVQAAASREAEDRSEPILVVDDSITVRRFTARLLERHRLNVRTAKDGVEASALLQTLVPSLVILDIEMPRMDGFEVASHIRNDARLANVPIIMVTSRGGEKHRRRAMEIGANHYLTKPYQELELLQTIEAASGWRITEPTGDQIGSS